MWIAFLSFYKIGVFMIEVFVAYILLCLLVFCSFLGSFMFSYVVLNECYSSYEEKLKSKFNSEKVAGRVETIDNIDSSITIGFDKLLLLLEKASIVLSGIDKNRIGFFEDGFHIISGYNYGIEKVDFTYRKDVSFGFDIDFLRVLKTIRKSFNFCSSVDISQDEKSYTAVIKDTFGGVVCYVYIGLKDSVFNKTIKDMPDFNFIPLEFEIKEEELYLLTGYTGYYFDCFVAVDNTKALEKYRHENKSCVYKTIDNRAFNKKTLDCVLTADSKIYVDSPEDGYDRVILKIINNNSTYFVSDCGKVFID